MKRSFQSVTTLENTRIGRYVQCRIPQEPYRAYVPARLPPTPPVDVAPLEALLEKANQALGRLDGIALTLPDPGLFIYMYVRKEAQIGRASCRERV